MKNDGIFEIKEKKINNIATKNGIILKVIYRFNVNELKQQRCVVCIITDNGISTLSTSVCDKEDNPLNIDVLLDKKEIDRFHETKKWALNDFRKAHPEVKKFKIR